MAGAPTNPSTPRLSEAAHHLVIPSGIVLTGWPRIRERLADMAVTFDPWQSGAWSVVLGKRADGKYACTVGGVVWSIPRQVGKTFSVGSALIAMCIEYPGLKVLWTAHRTRTITNTFRSMQGLVKRKRVKPHLAQTRNDGIRTANGEQEIAFRNGSTILFGAREQGFGRGFDEVDVIVFDEGQILTEKALEDMVASTNQARHEHGALIFYIGTPPRPVDQSEAFTFKRSKALSGESSDMMYLEFSADRDAKLDDRAQWAKANPSFPLRTPLESMLRLRENLPSDDAWRREALGIWDELTRADGPPITVEDWLSCQTEDAAILPDAPVTLCAEIALDRKSASISSVGAGADGKPCLTLLMHDYGTSWVADALIGLAKSNRLLKLHRGDAKKRRKLPAVVIDPTSPAGTLVDPLRAAGVEPVLMTTREVATAAAALQDALWHDGLVHGPSELVEKAVEKAVRRDLGDGLWAFGRKKSAAADVPVDITPLVALSNAHWAFTEAIQPYDLMSSFW